ncbi:unknown [Neodiprion lecontei nucleopolyhedrovirus]|uniref:Uncharacterized protein n=1 Tax=Neodiprion lecontei nucleopolyhedrovirus (strain Canada) TaxID=654906 RepID=Q6JPD4_NPVNC|nr:unknown [Neodiprion lecontei nucleopolyhedrovirus]AAQ99107.1 unknown [Neodiprion lecontei nucleopolyhedrovirus]
MIGYIFAFLVFVIILYLYCKRDDATSNEDSTNTTTTTKTTADDVKSLDYVKKELKNGWNIIMTGVNKKENEAKTQIGKKFGILENMIDNIKKETQKELSNQQSKFKEIEEKLIELKTKYELQEQESLNLQDNDEEMQESENEIVVVDNDTEENVVVE